MGTKKQDLTIIKTNLKKRLVEIVGAFFQEERGNRVTSNNTEGLAQKIITVVNQSIPDK